MHGPIRARFDPLHGRDAAEAWTRLLVELLLKFWHIWAITHAVLYMFLRLNLPFLSLSAWILEISAVTV